MLKQNRDYLVGDIRSLSADAGAVTEERPYQEGFGYGIKASDPKDAPMRAVTNPDFVNLLCRLKGGGRGVIDVAGFSLDRDMRHSVFVADRGTHLC